MDKYNKTDYPLTNVSDLDDEFDWDIYQYRDEISYLCELHPIPATTTGGGEKLEIIDEVADQDRMTSSCVYALVIAGKLFKLGKAEGLNGMKGRISSYNTGKQRYTTNSSTNRWVLQSFINMNQPITVYSYHPSKQFTTVFGETFEEYFPSSKSIERVILQHFVEEYGRKPIGNTQA